MGNSMNVADDTKPLYVALERASLSGPDTEVHPLKDALTFSGG